MEAALKAGEGGVPSTCARPQAWHLDAERENQKEICVTKSQHLSWAWKRPFGVSSHSRCSLVLRVPAWAMIRSLSRLILGTLEGAKFQ